MAKLSQLRRLIAEDFPDQAKWIEKLVSPINKIVEEVYRALDKGLGINDNMDGVLTSATWEGTSLDIAWSRPTKPQAVWIVDIVDANTGSRPVLVDAPFINWEFTENGALRITQVLGVTASSAQRYQITFIALAG